MGGAAVVADRLSDLPEGVLHTVLSFLPARQAVQTSVLSTKWRDLWSTMPYLDIDEKQFIRAGGVRPDLRFESFTTDLLLLHDAPLLDRFRLRVVDRRRADGWIRHSVRRRPAALEIRLSRSYGFAPYLDLPCVGSRYFDRLMKLHLSGVHLDGRFAEQLQHGCPVLEDVELRRCHNEFTEITLRTLKNLTVDSCGNGEGFEGDTLVVTAPRLASVRLSEAASGHYCRTTVLLNETAFLVKASVHIEYKPLHIERKLLGSLYNVTSLKLSGFISAPAMLVADFHGFPVFRNLRTLSLQDFFVHGKDDWCNRFQALGSFLQNALNLEKLILQQCMFLGWWYKEDDETIKTSLAQLEGRAFQCQSLKLIEIRYIDENHRRGCELLWGLALNGLGKLIVFTKI